MPRRPSKPPPPFNGLNLALWQSQDSLVTWAKRSGEFSSAIAVLQNEQLVRGLTLPNARADASMIQTGRMMGWSEAISALLALRQYPAKPSDEPAVTYGVDLNKLAELADKDDLASD